MPPRGDRTSQSEISASDININKLLLEKLISDVEGTKESVDEIYETFNSKLHDHDMKLVQFNAKLDQVSSDVSSLIRLIRDGGGETVLGRINTLENKAKNTDSFIDLSKKDKEENKKNGLALKVALVAGILSLIGTFVTAGVSLVRPAAASQPESNIQISKAYPPAPPPAASNNK